MGVESGSKAEGRSKQRSRDSFGESAVGKGEAEGGRRRRKGRAEGERVGESAVD